MLCRKEVSQKYTFARFRLPFMLAAVILLCGFTWPFQSSMPFNGDIHFHEIGITIPRAYIRDSTQSNEDLWIFEKGFYSKYILLSRKDLSGDADDILNNYAAYLQEQGVQSRRDSFLGLPAVRSSDESQEQSWREMLFVYNGSLYAVALRGGNEDDLLALLESVSLETL